MHQFKNRKLEIRATGLAKVKADIAILLQSMKDVSGLPTRFHKGMEDLSTYVDKDLINTSQNDLREKG